MVRVKHRYFLVQILYPDPQSAPFKSSDPAVPDALHFRQPTPDAITAPILLSEIRDNVVTLFGDYGAGIAGLSLGIKYFSPATSTFILRCPRAPFRLVWAALALITSLRLSKTASIKLGLQGRDRLPCVLRVIRVSGTIRKAEEAAIAEARRVIAGVRAGETGDELLERLIPKATEVEPGRTLKDADKDEDKKDEDWMTMDED